MSTPLPERCVIWADDMHSTPDAGKPERTRTTVYRLADGTYLTLRHRGPEEVDRLASRDRPADADGNPIRMQFRVIRVRVPRGAATESLLADLEQAGGRAIDPDLVHRLAAAAVADRATVEAVPWLAIASDAQAEVDRAGWAGRNPRGRYVEVRLVYYI